MKSKWTIAGILSAGLLLALAVGFSQAQGPQPPGEDIGVEGDVSIAAAVDELIPIQGRLTDANGNPFDGTFPYTVWFRIYDSSDGSTWLCSTSSNNLELDNGLFNITIPCSHTYLDGRQLYLGVQVGSDGEMDRQAIYPVPYAYSLVPGADIRESVDGASILEAENHSSTNGSKGLVGESTATSGTTYGVYGRAASPNGYGGYFDNTGGGPALKAAGSGIIQSTAATDWVVSPLKMVQEDSVNGNDLNIVPSTQFGYVKLYTDGQDDCLALLPVDVAAYLFGTRVNLSSFYFCYRMDNTDDKITQVDVEYVGTDGAAHNLCSYLPDVSSTTWACQTCTPTSPASIWGPVFVRFTLYFAGDGPNRGIRLGQMYLHLTE